MLLLPFWLNRNMSVPPSTAPPADSLQRCVAVRVGAGAEDEFSTGKLVCARAMLSRTCLRTQNANGFSLAKQAKAHTSGS